VQYKCYRQLDYRKTLPYPIGFIEERVILFLEEKRKLQRGYYEYND
jgi:hypothetical protein